MANEAEFNVTDVPTAGTAVQLKTGADNSRKVKAITLSALQGNMYFGDSNVSSTRCLLIINGNDPYRIPFERPVAASTFYVDAGTSGHDLGWMIEYAGRGG